MKNNKNKVDFNEIEEIILREKEEALPIFQKHDFRSRLNKRIKSESRKELRFPSLLKKPFPALLFFLILFSAIAFGLIAIFSPSPYKQNVRIINRFLKQTPAFQRQRNPEKTSRTSKQMNEKLPEFERETDQGLLTLSRGMLSSKELAVLFSNVLSRYCQEKQKFEGLPKNKDQERSVIKRDSESLRKENDFYQIFYQILKKLEEG
jgi:hypothetical protein